MNKRTWLLAVAAIAGLILIVLLWPVKHPAPIPATHPTPVPATATPQTVMADQLQDFLREFAQIPVGSSEPDFKQQFPDAKMLWGRSPLAYCRENLTKPPFEQVVFQFEKDRLYAAVTEVKGVDLIVRSAKPVVQAMEKTWGKPDKASPTVASKPSTQAYLNWHRNDAEIALLFTTPAFLVQSVEKGEIPNGRFILAIRHRIPKPSEGKIGGFSGEGQRRVEPSNGQLPKSEFDYRLLEADYETFHKKLDTLKSEVPPSTERTPIPAK